MNQILKDSVYNRGTQKHVDFLAALGGMNEEEKKVFQMTHDGKSDTFIQDEIGVSRKTYDRIMEAVRAKLLLAVFECINNCMYDTEQNK